MSVIVPEIEIYPVVGYCRNRNTFLGHAMSVNHRFTLGFSIRSVIVSGYVYSPCDGHIAVSGCQSSGNHCPKTWSILPDLLVKKRGVFLVTPKSNR